MRRLAWLYESVSMRRLAWLDESASPDAIANKIAELLAPHQAADLLDKRTQKTIVADIAKTVRRMAIGTNYDWEKLGTRAMDATAKRWSGPEAANDAIQVAADAVVSALMNAYTGIDEPKTPQYKKSAERERERDKRERERDKKADKRDGDGGRRRSDDDDDDDVFHTTRFAPSPSSFGGFGGGGFGGFGGGASGGGGAGGGY